MSSDPWDVNVADDEQEERTTDVEYNEAVYTNEEAADLVSWLGMPQFALLNRMFTKVRAISVEMMDGDGITLDDAEELVRHSAQRTLIRAIREMGPELQAYLQALESKPIDSER